MGSESQTKSAAHSKQYGIDLRSRWSNSRRVMGSKRETRWLYIWIIPMHISYIIYISYQTGKKKTYWTWKSRWQRFTSVIGGIGGMVPHSRSKEPEVRKTSHGPWAWDMKCRRMINPVWNPPLWILGPWSKPPPYFITRTANNMFEVSTIGPSNPNLDESGRGRPSASLGGD